jgi:hypothetical protein
MPATYVRITKVYVALSVGAVFFFGLYNYWIFYLSSSLVMFFLYFVLAVFTSGTRAFSGNMMIKSLIISSIPVVNVPVGLLGIFHALFRLGK